MNLALLAPAEGVQNTINAPSKPKNDRQAIIDKDSRPILGSKALCRADLKTTKPPVENRTTLGHFSKAHRLRDTKE
jgi:hypothetical protein